MCDGIGDKARFIRALSLSAWKIIFECEKIKWTKDTQ